MRKCIYIVLTLALLLSLCACGKAPAETESEGLQIVTTVFPAYDFARQIAGERAQVSLLVPPGAEIHSFEPTARDMIRVQNAALFVYNGGESEAWVEDLLQSGEEIRALSMLACVDALEEEVKEGMQAESGEEEEESEYDEHVWTSPKNAIRICEALCEELCAVDPEGESLYRENLRAYSAELEELDGSFREITENGRFRTVIFADRFPVRYFVEEYGLEYFAAFPGCAEETEPSAKTVAFLIDRVREQGIPAVFYIEFSNEKMADEICEDTGCEKLLFHSCHNVSADELRDGVSYLDLMRRNAEALKEALG